MERTITKEDAERFVDDFEKVCMKHGLTFYAVYADEILIIPYSDGMFDHFRDLDIDDGW